MAPSPAANALPTAMGRAPSPPAQTSSRRHRFSYSNIIGALGLGGSRHTKSASSIGRTRHHVETCSDTPGMDFRAMAARQPLFTFRMETTHDVLRDADGSPAIFELAVASTDPASLTICNLGAAPVCSPSSSPTTARRAAAYTVGQSNKFTRVVMPKRQGATSMPLAAQDNNRHTSTMSSPVYYMPPPGRGSTMCSSPASLASHHHKLYQQQREGVLSVQRQWPSNIRRRSSLGSSSFDSSTPRLPARTPGHARKAGQHTPGLPAHARQYKQFLNARAKCIVHNGLENVEASVFLADVQDTRPVAKTQPPEEAEDGDVMLLTVMNHANLLREALSDGSGSTKWVNERRKPPLLYAIEKGFTETAKVLLEFGADPNAKWQGRSVLLLAYETRQTELFHMLLDAGADVHARYGVQSTELLHIAVDEGRLSEAQALVARGAAVGTVCSGRSALVAACQTQREDFVSFLVQEGADVNDSCLSETPLLLAAQKNAPAIMQILLEAGAKVNVKDDLLNTPLHAACAAGSLDCVLQLLDHGANTTCRDQFGRTAAELADLHEFGEIAAQIRDFDAHHPPSLLRSARDVLRYRALPEPARKCLPDELFAYVSTPLVKRSLEAYEQ